MPFLLIGYSRPQFAASSTISAGNPTDATAHRAAGVAIKSHAPKAPTWTLMAAVFILRPRVDHLTILGVVELGLREGRHFSVTGRARWPRRYCRQYGSEPPFGQNGMALFSRRAGGGFAVSARSTDPSRNLALHRSIAPSLRRSSLTPPFISVSIVEQPTPKALACGTGSGRAAGYDLCARRAKCDFRLDRIAATALPRFSGGSAPHDGAGLGSVPACIPV